MDLNVTQKLILSEYMRLNPNVSKEKATQLLFGPSAKSQGDITLSNTNNTISFSNMNGTKVNEESIFGANTNSSDSLSIQLGKTIFKFFDKNGDGIIKDNNIGGVNEIQLLLSYIKSFAGTDGNLSTDEALKMLKDIDTTLDSSGAVSNLEKATAAEMLGFIKAVGDKSENTLPTPQRPVSPSALPKLEDFSTEEVHHIALDVLGNEIATSMGIYNSFKPGLISETFSNDDDPLSKKNQYYREYWYEKTIHTALDLANSGMLTEVRYRELWMEYALNLLTLEPDNPNYDDRKKQAADDLKIALQQMDTATLTQLVQSMSSCNEEQFEQCYINGMRQAYIDNAQNKLQTTDMIQTLPDVPFDEAAYNQSFSRKMDFDEVWQEHFYGEFNEQKILDYHYKEAECMIVTAANQRLAPLISKLEEYLKNPSTQGIEDSYISSLLLEAQSILGISGSNNAYSQSVNEFGLPSLDFSKIDIQQQDSEHYTYQINNNLLSQAQNLHDMLLEKYNSILNGKDLNEYQEELNILYKNAFQDEPADLINLANYYVQDKQETVENVKLGVNIVGGALVVAGTLMSGGTAAPLLMGSGVAISVAGSPGVSAIEGVTREGGITEEELSAIKQELGQNILLNAAGMGIGKISGTAYQALVIKNICPRLVALSAEIGIDATASLLTDLVITGQIDLTGEGIAQLVNILVGITHSKGNFDHFLDTHAGDVTNTNQYTRVTVNQEPSTPRINTDETTPTRVNEETNEHTNLIQNYEKIKHNILENIVDDPTTQQFVKDKFEVLDQMIKDNIDIENIILIARNLEYELKSLAAFKQRERIALNPQELQSILSSNNIQDPTIKNIIEQELHNIENLPENLRNTKLLEIEDMIYATYGLENQGVMLSDFSSSCQSPAATSALRHQHFTDVEQNRFTQALKFDGIKNYIDTWAETNPKMATILYNKYLSTIPDANLQAQCRDIANNFGTRCFIDSSNPNSKQLLDEIAQELQNWKTAGNGNLKLPRVIDDYNLTPHLNTNMAISWNSGSISINPNTFNQGASIGEILRHEIVHANDPNVKINHWDPDNNFAHAEFKKYKPQYIEMMKNAGIPEKLIEYGLTMPRELAAVACSSADYNAYSQEFKNLLIEMGAPKEIFDMPPVRSSNNHYNSHIYPRDINDDIQEIFANDDNFRNLFNESINNPEFRTEAEKLYNNIFVRNAHATARCVPLIAENKEFVFRNELIDIMPEPAKSKAVQTELLNLFNHDPEFQQLLKDNVFTNDEIMPYASRQYCRNLTLFLNETYTKNGYANLIREKILDKLPENIKLNYIKNIPEYDNLTPTGMTLGQKQVYELFNDDPDFQKYLKEHIFIDKDLTGEVRNSFLKIKTASDMNFVDIKSRVKEEINYKILEYNKAYNTQVPTYDQINTHATGETPHQPTRAEQLSTITNSNPNVRDFTDVNGNQISVSQEISTRLDNYPQYKNEIIDYMSVQRRRADDTTNPIEFLDTYIQTLNEFPQHKEFITTLANDPNLDGQSIRNIITEHGNNLSDQLKSDILLIASKGHDFQGINFYLRLFEQNPEFRNNFKTKSPDFDLIDNSTPTPQTQTYRNTIVNKINNTCPQELQTLKQTLGDEFFNKIKWEDILPKNATQKEITETIEYLNDCSKFFSRITTNEQRYGKNLAWAHNMNIISENAQIKIANGGNFDDVIYGIANEYRFYDVSTTLDSNNNLDDGTDRRFSSGKDRSTRPDYYRSSTSFNQDNYGNYFERFMKINPQDIKKPYNDAGQTYILPLEKDSGAMLHPEPSTIKASMKHASDAYNNLQPLIQKAQSGQRLSSEEIRQFHNNAAEIYYLVAHAMPWERGSNGIADIFMRSIYSSANIDLPALKPGVSLDLEAFCVDLKTYQQNWLNFFE